MRWIATCARGLEEILAGELEALGLAPSPPEMGGVAFAGGWREGLRANWRLSVANRVLVEIASWPAATDDELYRGARAIVDRLEPARASAGSGPGSEEGSAALPLIELFSYDRTFSIQATSTASKIRDTRWIAMKVKDAIVDGQRGRFGARSDVDRDDPDSAFRLRLRKDRATLLVDASGEPLDRRGYRLTSTAAPLRENLAAACVRASGWNGAGPVVDPMCGSGTFLAEAGAVARGLAPNRLRERWAFERLPGFERRFWEAVRAEPIPAPDPGVRLFGVDNAGEAMVASRRNLERAGLLENATLVAGDAFEFDPPAGPGLLAVNPPHGERMLDDREEWKKLGDLLKKKYSGWKAVVFAGGESQGKFLGLKPSKRTSTWAGPLQVKILVFDLW